MIVDCAMVLVTTAINHPCIVNINNDTIRDIHKIVTGYWYSKTLADNEELVLVGRCSLIFCQKWFNISGK